MKRNLLALILSSLSLASLRADIIFTEAFPYFDGTINATGTNSNGSTNWFLHSGSSDAFIHGHKLENASSSATGSNPNRSGDVHRNFTSFTNAQTVVFASFTVNCTNVPPAVGTYFAHFYVNSTTFHGRVFSLAGSLPNTWRLGIAGAAGTVNQVFPADLATNVDYQVVVGWDPVTLFAATLWVNPISSADANVVSGDAVSSPAASTGYGFRQASGAGNFFCTVSNLAVATTFDEAATNVWSTNAVSPLMVYQPQGGTNFPGENVNLSGVVAGQGIGTMTYLWLKDGAGVVNPNGNSNVLSFSPAAVSDSATYQLIATTPYGLSVTSTVANLWVTNAPIAPIITQQPPTNTTVFFHQTVTLHLAAVGPVPVTYQWLRNTVPVTDNANFSGSTSDTLTITDVLTNNGTAGTFRCNVTSPYGTTPSVNAVVAAIAPPANSIAFLRTLVDPVNFVATNSTLRWQATGTVTSFTNLTTGDTSSYYMQDATGCGINIFVTHGHDFRPNQGDVVTFVGWLSSFNSMLELEADTNDTTTSFVVLSNNITRLPAPKVIPFTITNNLAFCETNLEASIVMLTNVYFGTNAGVAISNTVNPVVVTNAAGQTFNLSFSAQDLDTYGQTLPDFAWSIVGNLVQNLGNAITPRNQAYQINVTRFSDIVTDAPPAVTLTIAHSGKNTSLTWSNVPYDHLNFSYASNYSYTVQAATNVAGPYSSIAVGLTFTNTTGFSTQTNDVSSQKYYRVISP